MHILSRGLPRGQEQLFKKNTFFGLYADGFFSIFGSPKGSIWKVCRPLFLAIFRLFSTPVHFRLHLGLFEAIFGPSGGAPTVFSWYFLSCRGSRLGHMQCKKGPKRIPPVEEAQRKHCVINSILINPPSRKEYSSRASSVLSPEGWYCNQDTSESWPWAETCRRQLG